MSEQCGDEGPGVWPSHVTKKEYIEWGTGGVRRWPHPRILWEMKDDDGWWEKTTCAIRWTALTTAFFAIFDINMMPGRKPGIANVINRVKFWGVPFIGGGIAYTSIVHTVSNLRGSKDDMYNHFWAGASVGAVVGAAARKPLMGCVTGFFLAIFALMAKDSALRGEFPESLGAQRSFGSTWSHRMDMSLVEDRPGYWVRREEDIPAMMKRGPI